jgi:S-adenosyl-L-methionine hydrolase (adenosine-forming)
LSQPIITLTTDYGTNDHLVGTVKGVILKINPDVTIVDITHNVMPFDVLDGALAIGSAYKYFPSKTVHLVIVDPGVGTERRPLLVSGEQQFFVGPDNGVFSLVYEKEERITVRHVTAEHYFLNPVSKTFHGRDVFAPVAAWLTKVWQTPSFGEEITEYARFSLPKPKAADGAVKGVILRVDAFGNLMTNLTPADLPEKMLKNGAIKMQVAHKEIGKMVETFAQGEAGVPVAFLGSSGFIEIAVNKGSAAKQLGVGRGIAVTVATS